MSMSLRERFAALEERNAVLSDTIHKVEQELSMASNLLKRSAESCKAVIKRPAGGITNGFITPFPFNNGSDEETSPVARGKDVIRPYPQNHSSDDVFRTLRQKSSSLRTSSDELGFDVGQKLREPPGVASYLLGPPSDACFDILNHEGVVRQIMIKEFTTPPDRRQTLDSLVVKMLRSLASIDRWERMKHFCNEVNGWDKLGPITRWRIEPTAENYFKLPLSLRPTELQMTRPHWPIIDWNPFPQIRDVLIQNVDGYDLTEVCSHMNVSFCLQMDVNINPDASASIPVTACDYTQMDFVVPSELSGAQNYDLDGTVGPEKSRSPLALPNCLGLDRNSNRNSDTMVTTLIDQASRNPSKIFFQVQEYIEYTKRPALADLSIGPLPEINEDVLTRLLLAFRQQEHPFKLHPNFFHRFPALYNEQDIAQGRQYSIYLSAQELVNALYS